MRVNRTIAAALGAAFIVGTPALADTKAGVDAWERGDYATAVAQWRRAADAGDADAQFNLGQAYKLGRGVPIDTAQAEQWFGKAAAKGHVQASDNYGLALFQNGHARDAVPYLEKSAARGEPRAQYILGTMLFNGADIKKDWVRAYALTSRSAQAGLPQAAQSLEQMDGFLSPADRQQGLALAARMDGNAQAALPAEVTGSGSGGGIRGVDLPPSRVAQGGPPVPPPYGAPPPPTDRYGERNASTSALPAMPPPYQPARPVQTFPDPLARPSRAASRPAAPLAKPAVVAASGRWKLQLGAFGDAGNARRLGAQMAGRFRGRSVDYVKVGALTKVLIGPFASRAEAAAACGSLSPCVPVGP